MEYDYNYRKRFFCSNCGKSGHEIKSCREPISSWGVININILDDDTESLILREKFSTKKNTYFKITSRKYPDIKCYMSDNIRLNNNQHTVYKLDDESIIYQDEQHIKHFCYYKDKILFMMVSRRFSLGFI